MEEQDLKIKRDGDILIVPSTFGAEVIETRYVIDDNAIDFLIDVANAAIEKINSSKTALKPV